MRKITLKVTARSDGRVCKRVNGRILTWKDEPTARNAILRLIAAREGRSAALAASVQPRDPMLAVRDLANMFSSRADVRMQAGKIRVTTFMDISASIEAFCAALDKHAPFGRHTPVASLTPAIFRGCRAEWTKTLGACAISRRVSAIRTMFNWALNRERLIDRQPHYGDEFSGATESERRSDRQRHEAERGQHRFDHDELKTIIESHWLQNPLRLMVLLGLNGGMYAKDCAMLKWADIKKEGDIQYVDTTRNKTQVPQKFTLWPETITALRQWKKAERPTPTLERDNDLVFITVHGNPFVRESFSRDSEGRVRHGGNINSINLLFSRLLRDLEIQRKGVCFGALRHTHVTATARHTDINARHIVRGHKIGGIEEHYDLVPLESIRAVCDYARTSILSGIRPKPVGRPPKRPSQSHLQKPVAQSAYA